MAANDEFEAPSGLDDRSDLGAARRAVSGRYRAVALILASVVGAAVLGWLAGSRLSTPEQLAAQTQPPPPSEVTVAVARRALAETLITRGDARFDDPEEVAYPAGALSGRDIVTVAPERGTSLDDGDVAFELSGAPVLVLAGDSPMYRDLGPGDRGRDVMQLEQGLERLGFDPGLVDGEYDAATAAAVRRWYEAKGYQAPGPSEQAQRDIEAARDAVDAARRSLRDARRSVGDALAKPSILTEIEHRAAVSTARERLATGQAQAAADLTAAEAARSGAQTGLDTAQMMRSRLESGQGPPSIRLTVEDLLDRAVIEAARESSAMATAEIDSLEWVLTLLLEAEVAFEGADPDERWDAARIDFADIERQAQTRVDGARVALDAARAGDQSTAQAQRQVDLAEWRLTALLNPAVSSALRRAVDDATEQIADAQVDLGELLSEHDTGLRVAQLFFFDQLPVRIDSVGVSDGDTPSGAVMTVSGQRLVIETSLPLALANAVSVGDRAAVDAADLGLEVEGVVSFIAEEPGSDGLSAQQVYAEIVPDEQPPGLLDASVRVVIPLAATDGEVLAVPVAALFSAANGATQLRVERAGGAIDSIEVTVGLRADGFVQVTPVDGDLTEGDRVVVGAG